MRYIKALIIIAIVALMAACAENPTPRQRGYFRVTFPKKEYRMLDSSVFQYKFEIPKYCFMEKENSRNADINWYNLVYKQLNAKVYISFNKLNGDLDTLVDDSHTLAYKHTVKADAIEKIAYYNDTTKVYGILYNLKGNVASPIQFYLTDSTKHFLRGSLYFNCSPNKDSLLPSVDFIREDIKHMFETLEWK